VELPVQVNSKVKGKIHISPTATREEIEKVVRAHTDLPIWIDAKKIQKIIVVPGRIVNLICT
jgi:leucyl-tRNA synthetase